MTSLLPLERMQRRKWRQLSGNIIGNTENYSISKTYG
jgi:hypothetical protein